MRIFVLYNDQGEIQSVARVEALAEGVEHPFFVPDKTSAVLELKGSKWAGIEAAELHDNYRVDTSKEKAVKKPAPRAKASKAPAAGKQKK
jgi:hypothetical protein